MKVSQNAPNNACTDLGYTLCFLIFSLALAESRFDANPRFIPSG